jgi:membrane protein
VAGLLWQIIGSVFATFMAGSTRYAAIYSSLAIVILFMIWVYIAWIILLVGASIAFYHQYPEYLAARGGDLRLSNRLRERLALTVAAAVAARHRSSAPPWTAERLSHALGVPISNVRNALKILEQGGYVLRTASDPPGFVPARLPRSISLAEVLGSIRSYGEDSLRIPIPERNPEVMVLERRLDQAAEEALSELTLADLVGDIDPEAASSTGTEQAPAPGRR